MNIKIYTLFIYRQTFFIHGGHIHPNVQWYCDALPRLLATNIPPTLFFSAQNISMKNIHLYGI
jgi:hypothetical protein